MTLRKKMHLKLKKGALHKELGVAKGKKLTSKQIAVHKGDSKLEKKRKVFAENARKWNHKRKSK
jgi:hypothetical protein